jgi:hypothetical protein
MAGWVASVYDAKQPLVFDPKVAVRSEHSKFSLTSRRLPGLRPVFILANGGTEIPLFEDSTSADNSFIADHVTYDVNSRKFFVTGPALDPEWKEAELRETVGWWVENGFTFLSALTVDGRRLLPRARGAATQ